MIISVINQKGGVSKTTSVFNIAGNLAGEGYKVLQVDIDPQASLTIANGIEPSRIDKSIYDVLCEDVNIKEVLHEVGENLKICVSKLDLSVAELSLVNKMARETILKKVLKEVNKEFDFILIDCPPNLGLLTINALCASDKVIIPASTDYLSLRGVDLLVKTVDKVKYNLNEDLDIIGIIATMHNSRTTHSNEILEVFKNNYNVIGTISESVRVKDSILAGIPLCKFVPTHKTTKEYKKISDKLIEIRKKEMQ
ncbi:MAG TPA: ParA family protein [Clostridiales bacterium]|nr:ParA family protein [Clostridiales bacterium]